jgi:hypothetical protein
VGGSLIAPRTLVELVFGMKMMARSLEKAKGLTPNNRATLVSCRSGGMIKRASSATVCSDEMNKKRSLADRFILEIFESLDNRPEIAWDCPVASPC